MANAMRKKIKFAAGVFLPYAPVKFCQQRAARQWEQQYRQHFARRHTPTETYSYNAVVCSLQKRADALPNVLICGRLSEYRYYDMDQAIARALILARRLLGKKNG